MQLAKNWYSELQMDFPSLAPEDITSYTLAHKIELTTEEEYDFLVLASETDRFNYTIIHLEPFIETVKLANRTKAIIKMKGHVKNFDLLDFKDFKL